MTSPTRSALFRLFECCLGLGLLLGAAASAQEVPIIQPGLPGEHGIVAPDADGEALGQRPPVRQRQRDLDRG